MSGHGEVTTPFDAADFLTDPADVAAYLRVALMEDSDSATLAASVWTAIRALERMPVDNP